MIFSPPLGGTFLYKSISSIIYKNKEKDKIKGERRCSP